jgi:Domain of unknown function (DUF4276)
MVTVRVYFEGGADPKGNPNVATIDNTNRLRESFNKLLNSGLENEKVRIQAHPAYSINSTVKIREPNSLLLIDLDGSKDKKGQRLKDNGLLDIQDSVFFMVQRMEAWILSQPEVIEEIFASFKFKDTSIKDDELIKGKDPENILHPDAVLDTILQRYFSYTKSGKSKKLKYGKLKHSPDLIEKLNIQQLKGTFKDVELLTEKINNFNENFTTKR